MMIRSPGTVIVTGSLGFIGNHLCRRLVAQHWHVIGVDNATTPSPLSDTLVNEKLYSHISGDMVLSETMDSVVKMVGEEIPAVIFHLACPAAPIKYMSHPIETLRVSAEGTRHAIELALRFKAILIFTSTSEVYGDPLINPQPESYWGNVNPIGPRSVYDEGKRYAEALISAYGRSMGLDYRIARLFNSYGPGMRLDDGRLIPSVMQSLLQKNPVAIHGEGTQTRSLCYVDDTVDGILTLWTKGRSLPCKYWQG